MRFSVFLAGMLMASSANAHVGHFGEMLGHDHWVAGGAIGVAIALAGLNIIRGKKDKEAEAEVEAEGEEEGVDEGELQGA